jgi:threonylcarbamoyladenosine tRNA methylthiotransferase MtaB
MGRAYTTEQFAEVVANARRIVPDIALETDVIVGFPGETDEEFAQSMAFCKRMAFSRTHVFRYSKRPGTPAAVAPHQVSPQISALRSRQLRALANRMRNDHMLARHGAIDMILVQEPGNGVDSHLLPVRMDEDLPLGSWLRVRLGWEDGVLVGTAL